MTRAWLCATASMLLLAAGPAAPTILRDQLWTVREGNAAALLTEAPAECLAMPKEQKQRQMVEIGRVLFRSPGILGGPAARLGLSCNACHPNGHTNTAFDLPELTDKPGAADVTAEWASAVRGDGIMNPVPIPDLTDVQSRKTFGHIKEPSLPVFVNKVITEEFQGVPLQRTAMAGLLAYLGMLRSVDCPAMKMVPITLSNAADEVRQALDGLGQAADPSTAQLLLLAAREAMGRIAERLPQASFSKERETLTALAREIAAWRVQIPFRPDDIPPGWTARFDGLMAGLKARENETYFNTKTLSVALSRP